MTDDQLDVQVKKHLPPWQPKPNVLEKVKQYFLGFAHNDREIFLKRRTLAKKLKLSVRTLDRYLHYLIETKWIETTKRTSRTAFRTVKDPGNGGSVGGSQKKENIEATTKKQHHRRDDVARPRPDLAASSEELELLTRAGVPRNSANLAWIQATVSEGIPIGHIRGAVSLARLRRLHAGNRAPIYSMKYFAPAVQEVVTPLGASAASDCCRHYERRFKTAWEKLKRGAA